MLETAYVVTWRWSDGSGSGATAAFVHKARADRLVEILAADQCSRAYKIEAVPFDSAAGATAGAPGATDAERAAWLADKIVAQGDYAKEAAAMLRRWPSLARASGRCNGCDVANGCPEFCRSTPGVAGTQGDQR